MNVVHVNYDAVRVGGATIAMLRTIDAQRLVGIDATIACRHAAVEGHSRLFTPSLSVRAKEFGLKCILRGLIGGVHSTGILDVGMAEFVNSMNPDILQLNWVQANTIGMAELKRIRCPIVWFTHDLWPMSGMAPYSNNNRKSKCFQYFDQRSLREKTIGVSACNGRFYVVSPSEWAQNCAKNSVVFSGVPCHCIHYPVSADLISVSKKYIGKPKFRGDRFTILFGATTGISSPIKGWDRLVAAIGLLPCSVRKEMIVRVFGCERQAAEIYGVRVEFLGKMPIERLVVEYRNADVFALPSRSETWGQTKTEALCCGTPVIAFDQAACANGIDHKHNGWVAAPDDIHSYAEGLEWLFSLWKKGEYLRIENEAQKYAPNTIGSQWMKFYESILAKRV